MTAIDFLLQFCAVCALGILALLLVAALVGMIQGIAKQWNKN